MPSIGEHTERRLSVIRASESTNQVLNTFNIVGAHAAGNAGGVF
jgi:hypothetical protein